MPVKAPNRECPFCKESVKADAARCKNCRAMLPVEPTHGGTCPFCREAIKRDALRCKHCGAAFGGSAGADRGGDCGCGKLKLGLDPASFKISDPAPADVPPPGTAAMPQGKRCSECTNSGGGLIIHGPWIHNAGKRTCSMLVPIGIKNGIITWKKIEWTENCAGTLVNDPWA